MKNKGPKVLILDIETSPLISYTWGLFDQNVSLNMVHTDWSVLSFAAKWLNESKVFYKDQRKIKNIHNDKKLLEEVWKLLDEADIVIGQNSKAFDIKKLNARFIQHGMQPPSSFRQIDTLKLAKKSFAFTSNKLEYLSSKLCTHKKLKTKKFQGFDLWKAVLAGNQEAWREMELYNKADVLATEELYHKIAPWGTGIDFNLYTEDLEPTCNCGSKEFKKNGFFYSSIGKFQRYKCSSCGAEASLKGKSNNLLTEDKKQSLLKKG